MIESSSSHRPWKGLAAVAALLALTHATAATPADRGAVHDAVGAMALRDACPAAGADLPVALNGAWDDVAKPSAVAVTFKVERHAVYDVAPESGSAHTFHQIRRAVHGLRCDGGKDGVRTVRFVVRFVDARDAALDGDDASPH